MRLGFFGANVGAMASPLALEVARFAEALGYASMWAGDHVVLPKPRREKPPLDPDWPMADPLLTLSFIAGGTRHIRLCTGVLVATQYQPVRLAKQAATLDVLSSGRFVMGLGLGYLETEFDVLGVPYANRRLRFRECVDAMRSLWTQESPTFAGRFVSFDGIDAHPRPVTPGGPPLVMGGYAAAGIEDAARYASGWYGFGLTPEATKEVVDALCVQLERHDRDPKSFEVFMTPRARLDKDVIEAYGRAGVTELVVSAEATDVDAIKRKLERNSPANYGIGAVSGGCRYAWED